MLKIEIPPEYCDAISRVTALDGIEEVKLAKVYRETKDINYRNALIESGLRLVPKIANRYVGKGLPDEDLIQAGNEGLIKAAEDFDPEKGVLFSTYAYRKIRAWIALAIINTSRVVRIPKDSYFVAVKVKTYVKDYIDKIGESPSKEDIIEKFVLTESQYGNIMRIINGHLVDSIDSTFEDGLFSEPVIYNSEFGESIDTSDRIAELKNNLKLLDKKERNILNMIYGLDDKEPMTSTEIGLKLGLTRQRIQQIENSALENLLKTFLNLDAPKKRRSRERRLRSKLRSNQLNKIAQSAPQP